jgi:hypothetical protein
VVECTLVVVLYCANAAELVQNKAAIAGILFVLPEDFEENGKTTYA